MADWPKHHLERAEKVRIESDGHTWEMDGPTFVRCLESGGWQWKTSELEMARLLDEATDEVERLTGMNAWSYDHAWGLRSLEERQATINRLLGGIASDR